MPTFGLPPQLAYALLASFALSLIPGGNYALFPFKLFTTWAHECSHALAALLSGGSVQKITLSPDTSGLTYFQLPSGRFRHAFVASAGYLGSCLGGCAIYAASCRLPAHSRPALLAVLGVLMLLTVVIWVRNPFGALTVTLLGVSMILLSQHGTHPASHLLLPFLGLQTGLNTVFDLRALFGLEPGTRSDAHTLRTLFWLPAAFWALLWLALSVALMAWTLKLNWP